MDSNATTRLHRELYSIAAARPGAGAPILERVYVICQTFFEDDPSLELMEHLRCLLTLMTDWTSLEGLPLQGIGQAALRMQLIECIDEVVDFIESAACRSVAQPPPFGSPKTPLLVSFQR